MRERWASKAIRGMSRCEEEREYPVERGILRFRV